VRRDRGSGDGDLSAEWRRLRRAALFFAFCALLVFGLDALGAYH